MAEKTFDTAYLDYLLEDENIVAENVSYDEFLRIFAGRRTEWLMGYVIEHMTNNPKHNIILNTLNMLFSAFLALKYPGSQVLLAGVSMFVGIAHPAREPDLIVLLPEHTRRMTDRNVDGIADIVVEIVSPESKKRDREKKL